MTPDRSAYLVQALQSMGQPLQAPTPPAMDPQMMAQAVHGRQAWQSAHPGGNYAAHGIMQLGRNVLGAPQAVLNGVQGLPGAVKGAIPGLARG